MKIRVDENGILRLESNTPLSEKLLAKIEKRIANKKETLAQMNEKYAAGDYDAIFDTI